MKDPSAKTLTWFAGILIFVGLMIMSPSGALFSFATAAVSAVFPALFGKKKIRLLALALLIAAIALAVNRYPEYREEHDRLSKRVKHVSLYLPAGWKNKTQKRCEF